MARSTDEVEALRPLWESLQGTNLPSDIDYFLAVSRYHPDVIRPHVVVVRPRDAEPSLLVGHLSRVRVDHRLGLWVPFRPEVSAINIYRGVVGNPTRAALSVALETMAAELGSQADAIFLHNLEQTSPLYEAAMRIFPGHARQRWSPRKVRWESAVDASPDAVLNARSRSTRDNLRRTHRRIAKDFGDRVSIRIFSLPSEAEALFHDVDTVAVKTYQTKFGPVFRDNEYERRLAEVGLVKGWFRAYVLYVDRKPIAFWTGYSYGGVFGWRGVTGYDPAFRSYGTGKYLLSIMLEDLARDPDVLRFSLGPGDLAYKRMFGDRRREEFDIRIFASTRHGVWVNVIGSGVQGLQSVLGGARRLHHVGERLDAWSERLRRKERRRDG